MILLILCAAGGALSIKLLELAELQHTPKDRRPDLRELVYWLPFLILPLLGCFIAYVYISSGTELTPILSANIGASAPLTIRAMANAAPRGHQRLDPNA